MGTTAVAQLGFFALLRIYLRRRDDVHVRQLSLTVISAYVGA